MKAIVFLLIAGVASLMAYFALRGECPGGTVVMSEAQCVQSRAFEAATCAAIFGRSAELVRSSATVYADRERCLQRHTGCAPHANVGMFAPIPDGFCVSVSGGRIASQEPVYRAPNAARVGGNS
jgi:hypothetical protein